MALTKLENLINPQVMADMISAKVAKKIVVSPFAKVDTNLQGQAGDTVTVPAFAYIGDAVDVAEGNSITATQLTASSTTFGIKKAMKAVSLSDEAVLSGYGNPVGEATTQLAKSIASKVDSDAMDALTTIYNAVSAPHGVQKIFNANDVLKYAGIVNAVDTFEEEVQSEKVMFVHPKQVTQLRLDSNFISADKYNNEVMMRGEIGMVAGVRIVPSKRVKSVDGTQGSRTVTIAGTIVIGDKFSIDGKELKLTIKENWQVFPTFKRGIDYVGYRSFLEFTLLRKSTCKNFKARMVSINKKRLNGEPLSYSEWCSINSYKGWLKHCDSYRLTEKYLKPLEQYANNYYIQNIKMKG